MNNSTKFLIITLVALWVIVLKTYDEDDYQVILKGYILVTIFYLLLFGLFATLGNMKMHHGQHQINPS